MIARIENKNLKRGGTIQVFEDECLSMSYRRGWQTFLFCLQCSTRDKVMHIEVCSAHRILSPFRPSPSCPTRRDEGSDNLNCGNRIRNSQNVIIPMTFNPLPY